MDDWNNESRARFSPARAVGYRSQALGARESAGVVQAVRLRASDFGLRRQAKRDAAFARAKPYLLVLRPAPSQ
jgi:hypothetical protein